MPVFFRPARRLQGKRHWLPPGVGALRTSVFTMAGTATMAGAATGIADTTLTAAGIATMAGVATGRAATTFTAAGVGALSGAASGIASRVFTAAGAASVLFSSDLRTITSRRILRDPVDCVMAGDADKITFKTGRAKGRALRHIYSE